MYYCELNKKVAGKFKEEFNRVEIDEFVGLKSKMYSLLTKNGLEVGKAKGINLKLRHNLYKDLLCNKKVVRHKMNRILSEKHRVGTCIANKISLSYFDDKRFILNDGINSLAYFHKHIVGGVK